MCFKLPAMSCDNTCGILPTRRPIRDSLPEVFVLETGGLYRHPLPSMCPNFRLEGKADVQHILYYLYKQCRHNEPFLSVLGTVGTFLKAKFQMPAKGQL